jgi:hypothetical protein
MRQHCLKTVMAAVALAVVGHLTVPANACESMCTPAVPPGGIAYDLSTPTCCTINGQTLPGTCAANNVSVPPGHDCAEVGNWFPEGFGCLLSGGYQVELPNYRCEAATVHVYMAVPLQCIPTFGQATCDLDGIPDEGSEYEELVETTACVLCE